MPKFGICGLDDIFPAGGKASIVDPRLDKLKEMFNSAKKVYTTVEIISDQDKLSESDGIIARNNVKLDLIIRDLEFVETRLARAENAGEKALLEKFKQALEKEDFLNKQVLSDEEKKLIVSFQLQTTKPIYEVSGQKDWNELLFKAYKELGYISFFTAGDKDAHSWPLKKDQSARDAAGVIHSDIQRGFIRAEVVHYKDLINCGRISAARQQGLLTIENKDYVVQDGDWMLFRFNK
ncbi:MAG: DUF933 domain-containing protein [Candidatus Omnitrophota bacterium]